MDVAVQQVVADVGGGSGHAFDKDLPFSHIKVVVQEGAALLGLPEELLGDASPELCGSGGGDGQNQHPPFNTSRERAAAHHICFVQRHAASVASLWPLSKAAGGSEVKLQEEQTNWWKTSYIIN